MDEKLREGLHRRAYRPDWRHGDIVCMEPTQETKDRIAEVGLVVVPHPTLHNRWLVQHESTFNPTD